MQGQASAKWPQDHFNQTFVTAREFAGAEATMQLARRTYEVLGTLGDEEGFLTCSMHVAKHIQNAQVIKPYPSFEEAAEDVKLRKISCLLVPGAYPQVSNFIMDSKLHVSETFIEKIPPLVLCGRESQPPADINVIFYHAATTHLLRETGLNFRKGVTVSSNSEACRRVVGSCNTAVAITNQLCAEHYDLRVYEVLRQAIEMPWICFTGKAADNEDRV